MIFEMLVVGAATIWVGYYRATMDKRFYRPYLQKWEDLMRNMKIKNEDGDTFEPLKISVLENGITYVVNIPTGFKVDKLENITDEINTHFEGITTIKRVKFANYCIVKIITKDISDFEFSPVKTKEYELYIGKTLDLQDYKVNLTKAAAHLLIGAPSGKGKSFLLASILTNLMYNSSNNIEIYLLQIMKGDIASFEKCKPVKFTAYTLAEVTWGLEKAVEIITSRDKKFRSVGINNLKNYNKHYPKSKLKRVYLVTEEISFFMESSTDNDEEKELKARCLEALKTIVKAGRSAGVHLITVTQRSTVDNIPSTLKSMMIRVSLGQISSIDSRNIIESDDAIYLDEKECLVYGDVPGLTPVRIPTIDEDFTILNKFVPEIKVPKILNHSKDNSKVNKETSSEVIKHTNLEKKEIIKEKKQAPFSFTGPTFKIINLERSIDSIENTNKKIKKRKGVYIEKEEEDAN